MFQQFNQIMHHSLDILSLNMTWYTNRVMTSLGLWIWPMWPKLLDGYSYLSKKYWICIYSTKMKDSHCLTLDKWFQLGISPTMQCLYIVLSGHTTMSDTQWSDMPENPMVDAEIMNLLLFCSKFIYIICLLLHKWGPCWILPPFKKHFLWNPLFKEYLYQILCFYQKLPSCIVG